jgi:integrase/recombinase XerD
MKERSKPVKPDGLLEFTVWLADRRPPLAVTTRRRYRRAVEVASEWYGGLHLLDAASGADPRRFLLTRPPHPSSQMRFIAAISMYFSYLLDIGKVTSNSAAILTRPKPHRPMPRPLPASTIECYLAAAASLGPSHLAVATLGLFNGFRVTEMATAEWSWFFEANGRVWIDVTGKGSRTGRVAAHAEVVAALQRLRQEHRDPRWLFPSSRNPGDSVTDRTVERMHKAICEQAGVKPFVLHRLRHSHATAMLASGTDITVVSRGLRHLHLSSTMHYAQVLDPQLAAGIDRLTFSNANYQVEDER